MTPVYFKYPAEPEGNPRGRQASWRTGNVLWYDKEWLSTAWVLFSSIIKALEARISPSPGQGWNGFFMAWGWNGFFMARMNGRLEATSRSSWDMFFISYGHACCSPDMLRIILSAILVCLLNCLAQYLGLLSNWWGTLYEEFSNVAVFLHRNKPAFFSPLTI